MGNVSGTGEPFIFEVPVLRMRRNIALAYVAFFLLLALVIPFKVGILRFLHGLETHPGVLVVYFIFVAGITIFLRLAYPPRATRPRLEVKPDSIRYIPGKSERLSGEPTGEALITPRSDEILLTRNLPDKLSDGHRLIISAAGNVEHEFKIDFLTHINAQHARQIADGITSATGLPVRLIQRLQSSGGVKEIPWVPPARKANLKLSAALMLGFLPFIGGGIVGYFVTQPADIVSFGLALWLCELLVISTLGKHKWTRRTALRGLTTIFTFGASYAAAAVFVFTVLRHR